VNADPGSARYVSTRALVGWSLFTIAIVWLALLYANFDSSIGGDGVLQRTPPALKYFDFVVGLFFTTPYIVTAIVCFGGFHHAASGASARRQLVLRSARNGFRAAVTLALLPCAFVLLVFGILGSNPAGDLVYGVPEGAITGLGICSLILLAAGLVGAFFGAVWGSLLRLSEGSSK
jgi:hypothetical protein